MRADGVNGSPRRSLVASLGATLRGDDGFGPALLARISRQVPPAVCVRDFGTHGVALVQALFEPFDLLVLLDSCRRGGRPGTVYAVRPALPEPGGSGLSVHLAGTTAVLALARSLGVLPPDIWLIGCEPAVVEDYRLGLSRPVRRALPRAARVVNAVIAGASA